MTFGNLKTLAGKSGMLVGASGSAAALVVLVVSGAGWLSILLLAAVSLGWAALCLGAGGNPAGGAEARKADEENAELTARTWALFGSLADEFNGQFGNIKSENGQVQGILADAIEKLIASFTGLQEQSRRQQELAVTLTSSDRSQAAQASEQMSYEAFLQEIDRVLQSLVDSAAGNSRIAESLVEKMNRTSSQFKGVLEMLGDVRKIANQTQMLALNAAIEAARAGKAGKGFAVVAEEVRNLSVRSNSFSEKIGESVSGIAEALSAVETTVRDMAEQDTRMVGEARHQVDGLMEKTRAFNRRLEASAQQISGISTQVEQEVRGAITSLQFQDMATQVLAHVSGRVEILEAVLDDLARLSRKMEEDDAELRDSCAKRLEQFRQGLDEASVCIENARHNPVSQKSMDQGEIELF